MNRFPFKFLIITAIVFILDQASKIVVRKHMLNESIDVIGDFFRLTHVENAGAAFGMSIGSDVTNRIFFSITAVLLTIVLLFMFRSATHLCEKIAYSLIIGGALGNILDRLLFGSVTDFFDFKFFSFIMERWPIFNIADSAIVCGVTIMLTYYIIIEPRHRKNTQPTKENES